MKSAVLLSCSVLLAGALGCSKDEPANQAAAPAPPQAAAAAPQATAATSGGEAPAGGAQPALPAAKRAALATAEGKWDGVRVEVTELKRTSGGTLTLRFAIANDSEQALGHGDVGVGFGGLIGVPYAIDGVHLIDPIGKKKYFVAKDTGGGCICSQFDFVKPGTRANHWAKFSAPPDDVERITVVVPSFAPLEDVPISR